MKHNDLLSSCMGLFLCSVIMTENVMATNVWIHSVSFFLLSSFDFYEARKKVRTSIQQRQIDVQRLCQWHETERNEHFGI